MTASFVLGQEWRLGPLRLANRVVMAPMSTQAVDGAGHPTADLQRFLVRRAQGGCAAIILESATVDAVLGGTGATLRLDSDAAVAPLRRLVQELHASGTAVIAQLWHAGPRAICATGIPLSPSGSLPGCPESRAASVADIVGLVRAFADAGARAVRAGCDVVEIHAAHGYLLHHFVDEQTNRRRDAYGGSVEGRYRVLVDIREALRLACPHTPVIARVSFRPSDDFAAVGSVLERNGYDGIDVRTGFSSMPAPVKVLPPGYALPLAARLRPHVKVPLLAGGRITTPLEAAAAIRDAGLAAVVLGRALLRDPDWPRKALSGHAVDACPYTCDPSCYSEFKAGARLHCLRAGTNG